MKKTKKLLACLIAAATMFTMGSTAFAAETAEAETKTPVDSVTLTKSYKLEVADMKSPAETFNYTVTAANVTDAAINTTKDNMPMPKVVAYTTEYTEGEATVEGKEKTFTIELPNYNSVGIYYYTVAETKGNTLGVTYDEKTVTLKVTVVNNKSGDGFDRYVTVYKNISSNESRKLTEGQNAFENTYSANSLPVKKVVTGNLGDKNKFFTVTVTLKNNTGKTMSSDISYKVGEATNTIKASDWENNIATAEINLKHDQTIAFTNLPFGVTYDVTEADYTKAKGGYDAPVYTYTNTNKTVNKTSQNVTITNNKGGDIDTGVNLTTLPYILVFAGVIVIAGAAFITRRRKYED